MHGHCTRRPLSQRSSELQDFYRHLEGSCYDFIQSLGRELHKISEDIVWWFQIPFQNMKVLIQTMAVLSVIRQRKKKTLREYNGRFTKFFIFEKCLGAKLHVQEEVGIRRTIEYGWSTCLSSTIHQLWKTLLTEDVEMNKTSKRHEITIFTGRWDKRSNKRHWSHFLEYTSI